jgi:molybdate transport repressor ModE-like protein
VVATASGGARGGTSRLTTAGERLLTIYTGLRRDHARCLETLNARLEQEWNRPLRADVFAEVTP